MTEPFDVPYDPTLQLYQPHASFQEFDERAMSRARRKAIRRTTVSDPPALPASELPKDGVTRFDWRQRSLSRTGRAKGLKWFPGMNKKRVEVMGKELLPGETFHEEVERYEKQYVSA